MTIYELPPMLQGTPEQQLADLRQYLIRLINTMNEENIKQGDFNDRK